MFIPIPLSLTVNNPFPIKEAKTTEIFGPPEVQHEISASDLPCFRFAGSDAHLILTAPKAGGAGRPTPLDPAFGGFLSDVFFLGGKEDKIEVYFLFFLGGGPSFVRVSYHLYLGAANSQQNLIPWLEVT